MYRSTIVATNWSTIYEFVLQKADVFINEVNCVGEHEPEGKHWFRYDYVVTKLVFYERV